MDKKNVFKLLLWSVALILLGSLATTIVYTKKNNMIIERYNRIGKLALIYEQIEENYVDSVDFTKINETVIPLVLKKLDPHTVYLPPKDLEDSREGLEGNFDGVGLLFNVPEDTAIVINVIVGGPSEKAGLLSGDKIIKVGERVIAGTKTPQDSMVALMRGKSGTKVNIGVLRGEEALSFDVVRGKIPVKSIDVAYMLNDTTAYVKLSKFSKNSYSEFMKAVTPLVENGANKLIFDLRDNTGGFLDQALLLSNEFLDKGDLIVYMQGLHRNKQEFFADGMGKLLNMELSVLINENSASSSEIMAGAIQDNDRGNIIGRRSFGKGLVQEPIYFSDKSGIYITVARFYTPTGRSIQKPYSVGDKDYSYDIVDRYIHGEMTDYDSIPKNDSLKFYTSKGKVVYGGGGIIPDIFVPIDTVGVSNLYLTISKRSLLMKFSAKMAEKYRSQLGEVSQMEELNLLLDNMNLQSALYSYLRANSVDVPKAQWDESGKVIMTQLRALIGRYSKLEDNAFYPIIDDIDNVLQRAVNVD